MFPAGVPVLIGVSRKSTAAISNGEGPDNRLAGSLGLAMATVAQGASCCASMMWPRHGRRSPSRYACRWRGWQGSKGLSSMSGLGANPVTGTDQIQAGCHGGDLELTGCGRGQYRRDDGRGDCRWHGIGSGSSTTTPKAIRPPACRDRKDTRVSGYMVERRSAGLPRSAWTLRDRCRPAWPI